MKTPAEFSLEPQLPLATVALEWTSERRPESYCSSTLQPFGYIADHDYYSMLLTEEDRNIAPAMICKELAAVSELSYDSLLNLVSWTLLNIRREMVRTADEYGLFPLSPGEVVEQSNFVRYGYCLLARTNNGTILTLAPGKGNPASMTYQLLAHRFSTAPAHSAKITSKMNHLYSDITLDRKLLISGTCFSALSDAFVGKPSAEWSKAASGLHRFINESLVLLFLVVKQSSRGTIAP